MPTTNKGLNQPVLGSTGWGTPLNENATILDLALGAFEIVAGTSGTVTLSTTQVQSMCLKSVTAAFSADVTYVVPSGVAGQWLVTNQSAASAFSVIVKNAASATSVSVPNGQSRLVYSDGTKVIYSVDNVAIATQAQAEAATDNTTIMTPLRTSQQVQSTIASQAQAEAGTDNTTLMTPLRTEQHTLTNDIGWNQTWQAVTRTNGTVYQNTTGRPIVFSQSAQNSGSTSPITVEMSPDNVTFIQTNLAMAGTFEWTGVCTIVPANYYYRTTAVGTSITTRELR